MAVFAGVTQGSILGPLLFFIFINIINCIGASILLFADDTGLYILVDLLDQEGRTLNTDLKQFLIGQILDKQTLSIIFTRKSNPIVHPSLFMHCTMINETTNHKHLCLFSPITNLG